MPLDRRVVGGPDPKVVPLGPTSAELRADLHLDPRAGGRIGVPRGNCLEEAEARRRDRAERLADKEAATVVEVAPIVAAGRISVAAWMRSQGIELELAVGCQAH